MLPSFQHCWLLNVLRIYRYIWCAVLFLSDTFIFDPSFHCSQETREHKPTKQRWQHQKIVYFIYTTLSEKLEGEATWKNYPAAVAIKNSGSISFTHGVCHVIVCWAMKLHRPNEASQVSTEQQHMSESSTSTLAPPLASLCCSTIAFLIGIKCDSRQLFSWGCYFRTVYLNLTWHPHTPCAACPKPAFLLLPAQRQGRALI